MLLIHDYAGHPFQVQLSRSLARRGHRVVHAYCGSTVTPRGTLAATAAEEGRLSIESLDLGEKIAKELVASPSVAGSALRATFERLIDRLLARSGCVGQHAQPAAAQGRSVLFPAEHSVCQLGGKISMAWRRRRFCEKNSVCREIDRNYFIHLDKQSLRLSDAVVVITEDFIPTLRDWGLPTERVRYVPNWAPLDECDMRPKDNACRANMVCKTNSCFCTAERWA